MRGFASETILKDHRQEQVRLGSELDLAVRQSPPDHFNLAGGNGIAPEELAHQFVKRFSESLFPMAKRPARQLATRLKAEYRESAAGVREIVLAVLGRGTSEPLAAFPLVAFQPSNSLL